VVRSPGLNTSWTSTDCGLIDQDQATGAKESQRRHAWASLQDVGVITRRLTGQHRTYRYRRTAHRVAEADVPPIVERPLRQRLACTVHQVLRRWRSSVLMSLTRNGLRWTSS